MGISQGVVNVIVYYANKCQEGTMGKQSQSKGIVLNKCGLTLNTGLGG